MAKTITTKGRSFSRGGGFKPLSKTLLSPTKRIGEKRGFYNRHILSNWKDIVGEELANLTRPREMRNTRNDGATLVLECVGAYVSELTMRKDEIIMRINSAVGGNAIAKIQFAHSVVGFAEDPAPYIAKPQKNAVPPVEVSRKIDQTSNSNVKEALASLSQSFYNKKEKQ